MSSGDGVRIWWDVAHQDLTDELELQERIVETLNRVNPWGTRGITMWLGPAGAEHEELPMQLDLDPEPGAEPVPTIEAIGDLPPVTAATVGAARVMWLPDHTHAIEPGFAGREIQVMTDSSEGLVAVSAAQARVSILTALRLAAEYGRTGVRPASIEWIDVAPE
jgi:hypothetical protein